MELFISKAKVTGLSLLLLIFSSPLYALSIDVGTVVADWNNVQGGAGSVVFTDSDTITGDEQISWGTPPLGSTAGQSGYRLDGASSFTVETGDIFSVGNFTHTNQPILDSITGAQLDIFIDLMIGSTALNEGPFSFFFNHNETLNNCTTSPDCANDIVSITTLVSSDSFFFDGIEYTLDLVGFSVNGLFTEQLSTEENSVNTAQLLGTFRAVPAPPALLLMVLGLIGIALSRKTRPVI